MNERTAGFAARSTDHDSKVYRIAISMSGAISAGAYTAGVFDFLIQALAELQHAAENPDHEHHHLVPRTHEPRIIALTGASAGGITAALGAVGLGYGLAFEPDPGSLSRRRPISLPSVTNPTGMRGVLPALYDAWVIKPRMMNKSHPFLLSTTEPETLDNNPAEVVSLLNTAILDKIRADSLAAPPQPPMRQAPPYRFFFDTAHLYLTVTNLTGIQYDVQATGGSALYHMVNHADRVHFKIGGLGNNAPNPRDGWAEVDRGRELTVAALRATGGRDRGWQAVGKSALATSAFPAGLSARILDGIQHGVRKDDGYTQRGFPAPRINGASIAPIFPSHCPASFKFANSDGGVINNDPFDFARYTLLKDWRANGSNERRPELADRSVIMIAPFPEGKQVGKYEPANTALVNVLSVLVPALTDQARFKVDELAAAVSDQVASRWLIAPRRYGDTGWGEKAAEPSSRYIACGALGGFGGFLDQKFREHDYQLGRRNCQAFLRGWKASYFTRGQKPIIPLVGSAAATVPQPEWPRMSRSDFDEMIGGIRKRYLHVVRMLTRRYLTGWRALLRWPLLGLAWLVWYLGGGRWLRRSIEANLDNRKQLEPV